MVNNKRAWPSLRVREGFSEEMTLEPRSERGGHGRDWHWGNAKRERRGGHVRRRVSHVPWPCLRTPRVS